MRNCFISSSLALLLPFLNSFHTSTLPLITPIILSHLLLSVMIHLTLSLFLISFIPQLPFIWKLLLQNKNKKKSCYVMLFECLPQGACPFKYNMQEWMHEIVFYIIRVGHGLLLIKTFGLGISIDGQTSLHYNAVVLGVVVRRIYINKIYQLL
jgi:hypothetical protein